MECIIKEALLNLIPKSTGRGGCINEGEIYNTDDGKHFIKRNSKSMVKSLADEANHQKRLQRWKINQQKLSKEAKDASSSTTPNLPREFITLAAVSASQVTVKDRLQQPATSGKGCTTNTLPKINITKGTKPKFKSLANIANHQKRLRRWKIRQRQLSMEASQQPSTSVKSSTYKLPTTKKTQSKSQSFKQLDDNAKRQQKWLLLKEKRLRRKQSNVSGSTSTPEIPREFTTVVTLEMSEIWNSAQRHCISKGDVMKEISRSYDQIVATMSAGVVEGCRNQGLY